MDITFWPNLDLSLISISTVYLWKEIQRTQTLSWRQSAASEEAAGGIKTNRSVWNSQNYRSGSGSSTSSHVQASEQHVRSHSSRGYSDTLSISSSRIDSYELEAKKLSRKNANFRIFQPECTSGSVFVHIHDRVGSLAYKKTTLAQCTYTSTKILPSRWQSGTARLVDMWVQCTFTIVTVLDKKSFVKHDSCLYFWSVHWLQDWSQTLDL